MTQSPRMQTRKQNRGGRTFPDNHAVTGMKEGYARQKQKKGHPSRGLVTPTISSMLRYRFALGAKGDENVFSISFIVTGSLMPSENGPPP